MRERGLKYTPAVLLHPSPQVAPHAGAWIEILTYAATDSPAAVAPHAGAWIEIAISGSSIRRRNGRSPCGSVD